MTADAIRFYYLENFRRALDWLSERYPDLLASDERAFAATFSALPRESSALLVRMISRRGSLFRRTRLKYEEIGCVRRSVAPLVEAGMVDAAPTPDWAQLGRLATKPELLGAFELPVAWRRARKEPLLAHLQAGHDCVHALARWLQFTDETLYRLLVAPLCERLRLMFFGNFHQDWSEFVLADLGIHRYEPVAADQRSRAFQRREEIDQFVALYRCRELLHEQAGPETILAALPPPLPECPWIETHRVRMQLRIAQLFEKAQQPARALDIYLACEEPRSRIRAVRILEKLERCSEAWQLLAAFAPQCTDEQVLQEAARIRPRLSRRLGHIVSSLRKQAGWSTFELQLPRGDDAVEELVARHLGTPLAPMLFVENTLLNSLLGLLCWDALFAPLPGAFFHEFHAAPADLLAADFRSRRAQQFTACLGRLESADYRARILETSQAKVGRTCAFVAWGALTPQLLTLALECIPAAHLRAIFERILANVGVNRSGLPDLIQFFPAERRYRLIEVKAPGDRLQSNQIRWLDYLVANAIDVSVCKVTWSAAAS